MNASSEVLQKFTNVDWLYRATRSNICFQSRCWVLFYSALLNRGALFGLVATFSNASEGALLGFNLTVWHRSQEIQEHRYRLETAPTKDLPELCLGGRPGGFAQGTTPQNSVGLLAPRTSAETWVLLPVTLSLFEPFLSRGRSCCFTRASKNESRGCSNWATLLISLWKVGVGSPELDYDQGMRPLLSNWGRRSRE